MADTDNTVPTVEGASPEASKAEEHTDAAVVAEKDAAEPATAEESKADAEVPTGECTVFQSPLHYTIKHPLRHSWTLWYDIPVTKVSEKDWLSNLKQIMTMRYVEDFWGYVVLC